MIYRSLDQEIFGSQVNTLFCFVIQKLNILLKVCSLNFPEVSQEHFTLLEVYQILFTIIFGFKLNKLCIVRLAIP